MESFWAQQDKKNQQSLNELCTDVTFSNRLRACEECDVDEALEFLLQHYDPHGQGLLYWLLAQSDSRVCLRVQASNAIVAFACSVPLWVTLPDFDGLVSLGTLLCVVPPLRRTGLVTQFLEWSIGVTAKAGFQYRMSTSTAVLAMAPVCTVPRFLQKPHALDKKAYKALMHESLGGPLTLSKNMQDTLSFVSQGCGVKWTKTLLIAPFHTVALLFRGEPVFAALVIDVNAASKQVLAYRGPSKHLGACWAWLAMYMKTILVFDAWQMPEDKITATPCSKISKYHVYFHNVHPQPQAALAIPML